MSNFDYFSTVKYEPPEKRGPSPGVFIAIGVVALGLIGGAAWYFLMGPGAPKEDTGGFLGFAPAAVSVGKPMAWRTLDTYDWLVSGDHPRPTVTVADFNRDGAGDILQVDFKAKTNIIEPNGGKQQVRKARWLVMSRFTPWDFNSDGVSELVPEGYLYAYLPTASGTYTTQRLRGG